MVDLKEMLEDSRVQEAERKFKASTAVAKYCALQSSLEPLVILMIS